MGNVLSAELYKLKYNIAFYICLIVSIVANFVSIYMSSKETGMVEFNDMVGMMPLFLIVIITSIACDDYEKGTMKNLLSSGNSRKSIFNGKLCASFYVGFIFFFVDGISAVLAASFMHGMGTAISPMKAVESLVAQLLLVVVYAITFYGFATVFRSSKLSMIVSILYYLFVSAAVYMIGFYVFHADISKFALATITKGIADLSFTMSMIINFVIYGAFGILLCAIGYLRFKKYED